MSQSNQLAALLRMWTNQDLADGNTAVKNCHLGYTAAKHIQEQDALIRELLGFIREHGGWASMHSGEARLAINALYAKAKAQGFE